MDNSDEAKESDRVVYAAELIDALEQLRTENELLQARLQEAGTALKPMAKIWDDYQNAVGQTSPEDDISFGDWFKWDMEITPLAEGCKQAADALTRWQEEEGDYR